MSHTSRSEGGMDSTQGSDTQNLCACESGNAGGRSEQTESDKVTRYVHADEWWPVYSLDERQYTDRDTPVVLTEEDLADYHEAMRRFQDWQERLGELSGWQR